MGHGFRSGLVLGLIVSLGVVLLARRRAPAPAPDGQAQPWAGLAFVAASVLALVGEFTLEAGFVLGLLALSIGALLTTEAGPLVRMAAAVPGAIILARSIDVHHPGWATVVMLVVTVAGGVLVADFDRAYATTGLPPVLLAVTVLGVYVTTPDTDHAVILAGAVLPVALLGALRLGLGPGSVLGLGSGLGPGLGVVGSSLVAGLVSWVVVTDGAGRPGAVVGGFACLGLLVLEPVVRRASRVRPDTLALATVHVVLVAVCSRVAGLRTPASQALAISAAAYVAAAVLLVVLGRRRKS